jgi:hypothetical protein
MGVIGRRTRRTLLAPGFSLFVVAGFLAWFFSQNLWCIWVPSIVALWVVRLTAGPPNRPTT